MSNPRRTLRTTADLIEAGLVEPSLARDIAAVAERYALAVTPGVRELIDAESEGDPIARQFVPSAAELVTKPDERVDPIGDEAMSPVKGIVHRYPDRVLLKLTGVCPVYCRFCFRREMIGPAHGAELSPAELDAAIAYVRATPAIWEVIVTGGDPLGLSPRRLRDLTRRLASIEHVKILRWHSRVPVVAPERVTSELVAALASARQTSYVAIHTNHVRELSTAAEAAISRLASAGLVLLSQTVLLKGVNDDAATLEALFRRLVELRVKPYYLHHGDLAPGTSHFRTSIADGQALAAELRRRLSGVAQPTYVIDIPGGHGKVPAGGHYVRVDGDGGHVLTDPHGGQHAYRDPRRCCTCGTECTDLSPTEQPA